MKLTDLIICDDIRQEVGNKFTLVGVYDSEIRIQTSSPETLSWPLPLNIALFCRVELEANDSGLDEFELQITHDGIEIVKLKSAILVGHKDRPIPITTRMPGFPITGAGVLRFDMRFSFKGITIPTGIAPKSIRVSVERVLS